MSLLTSLLAGGSGLRAANAGVNAASHNVTNAATPGYSRRRVEQTTADPVRRGGVWYGLGVSTDRIARPTDTLLQNRRITQGGLASGAEASSRALAVVESMFASSETTGARESLDLVFDALTSATADPADRGLRRRVLDAASGFAANLSQTASRLATTLEDFEATLQANLDGVNEQLAQVAHLNGALKAAGGGFAAGDLADQRDRLVSELASSIGVTADHGADGSVTLFVGGHAVVSGVEARRVAFDTDSGAPRLTVSADKGRLDVTASLGGSVGGLLDAHETTSAWLADLDTAALAFAQAFNAQHAAGYDATGAPGGAVFTWVAGSGARSLGIDAAFAADPSRLALASQSTAAAGDDGNLRMLSALENTALVGTTSAGDALTDLAGRIGVEVARRAHDAAHQGAVLADVEELHQALVGVDLDEEAANLVMYQAAYQAAAKVIQTTDAMLSVLMDLV